MPFSTFAGYLWSVNICISGCLAWRIDWCVLSPPGCCCGSHVVPPKQMNYVMRYRHPCISSVACSTTPHRIYNGLCLGFPHDVSVLSGLFFLKHCYNYLRRYNHLGVIVHIHHDFFFGLFCLHFLSIHEHSLRNDFPAGKQKTTKVQFVA